LTGSTGWRTRSPRAAPDPEPALLPEDVLGGQAAQLADAETGVEQDPSDETLGGRLAGVGEAVGLLGGEGLANVLVEDRSPRCSGKDASDREGSEPVRHTAWSGMIAG
jgi:hypothetical protein